VASDLQTMNDKVRHEAEIRPGVGAEVHKAGGLIEDKEQIWKAGSSLGVEEQLRRKVIGVPGIVEEVNFFPIPTKTSESQL
jgi:hypothetical protein